MAPSSRALARPLPPPPSYYSCSHCGAHFASLQALGGHKSIHSSKRRGTADVSVDAKRPKHGASPASPPSKSASPKGDTWRPSREGAGVGSSIRGQLLELLNRQGLGASTQPGLPSAWEYPSFSPPPTLSSTLPQSASPSHVSGLWMDPWAMAPGWQGAVGPTAAATAGWELRPHPHPVGGLQARDAVALRPLMRPVQGMVGAEGSEVINLSPREATSGQGLGGEGGSGSRGASSECHEADVGHSAAWAKVLLAGAARKLLRFAEAQGVPHAGARSPVSRASSGLASVGASSAIESQSQSRVALDAILPSFGRDTKSAGTRSPTAPTTHLFPGVQSQTVNRLRTFNQSCSEGSAEEKDLEKGSLLPQTQAPSHRYRGASGARAPEVVTTSRVAASPPLRELNLLEECNIVPGGRLENANSKATCIRKASAGLPGSLLMLFDNVVAKSHTVGLKDSDLDLTLRL